MYVSFGSALGGITTAEGDAKSVLMKPENSKTNTSAADGLVIQITVALDTSTLNWSENFLCNCSVLHEVCLWWISKWFSIAIRTEVVEIIITTIL